MPAVARVGDKHLCPIHGEGTIITGSDTTIVEGSPIAREGDQIQCPDGHQAPGQRHRHQPGPDRFSPDRHGLQHDPDCGQAAACWFGRKVRAEERPPHQPDQDHAAGFQTFG